ncbi:MAG: tRNA pseudouridine(38-40) synthase TruA [Candidatus Omnitrophota bacterium]|nr:tRNA pseudouridine(38-40) synthase TruA [Candidatus Omnitrophota bacterium]
MRNIKLIIEYDGTNFNGWQVQKVESRKSKVKIRTVQETLEQALKQILQEKIKLAGSGRTDSGVHALGQVANFKTKSRMPVVDIKRALNAVLPEDIVIHKVEEAALKFHARFKAKSKIYRYAILNRSYRSTRENNFSFFYPRNLNLNLMCQEAKHLVGNKDLKSFQATDKKDRSSRRIIKNIRIHKKGDFIFIDIESNGFLYKMARNIAGTLIEVGRGKLPVGSLPLILKSKDRKTAGPTAPACGLTLLEVKY